MSPSHKKQALVCLERLAFFVAQENPPTQRASLDRDLAFLRAALRDFDALELGALRAVEIQARLILPTAKRCGVKVLELVQALELVRAPATPGGPVAQAPRNLPAELAAAAELAPKAPAVSPATSGGPVAPALPGGAPVATGCAKSQASK